LTKRFCKYCEKDITSGWPKLKVMCQSPECRDKHRLVRNADIRIRNRIRYMELKQHRMKGTTCLNCNVEIPVEQDVRIPVCLDPACGLWWDKERVKRKTQMQRARYYKNKHKPSPKVKPIQPAFKLSDVKPEDFFNQTIYERQQAELEKPNGRTCQWPSGCGKPLIGNNRQLCKYHQGLNEQRGNIFLWDKGYDGSTGGRQSHALARQGA
jgi:hypothetical protein